MDVVTQAAQLQNRELVTNSLSDLIRGALKGLQYGSIELVVHNGRVVQVERREKIRLENMTSK